jgi:endo-beta-N-acetylglucosaminidase D
VEHPISDTITATPLAHKFSRISWTRRDFSRLAAASLIHLYGAKSGFATEPSSAAILTPRTLAPMFPLAGPSPDSFAELMVYDPTADPDAKFFRSIVPRASRIAAFAPTQAHPTLSPLPQLAGLTGCYRSLGPEVVDTYKKVRYGLPPRDGVYISRMVAYHDVLVNWSGPGVIPNPAMTDAAHRNGALCLGTIFQPDRRIYDSSVVPARKVAAKFVELAIFFGFDGYFVNFEMGTPQAHREVHQWMSMMREEARAHGKSEFYIQFYDGTTLMDRLMPVAESSSALGRAGSSADSAMLDQGWSGYSMTRGCCSGRSLDPATVSQYCNEHGLDPFASAYFGFQLYPGPGYFGLAAPSVIHPNDSSQAYGSLQIYSYEDGLHTMLEARKHGSLQTSADSRQEEFYALERSFFSGQSQNPALENQPDTDQALTYAEVAGGTRKYSDYSPTEERPTDQIRLPITFGVANFTVEHSVIGDFPFLTRFNLGEGEAFFIDGAKASNLPWFNMGIQDLLPTWQWWMEPISGFLDRSISRFEPLDIRYDKGLAFHGGSSLHISGKLLSGDGVALRLFKMKLPMQSGPNAASLHIVWLGSKPTKYQFQLGLVFEDSVGQTEWIGLADASRMTHEPLTDGWVLSRINLTAYHGRTLAALLLGFKTGGSHEEPAAVDIHIGEIYIGTSPEEAPPSPPSGFTLEAHTAGAEQDSVQARLHWKMDEAIVYYDLFSVSLRGNRKTWLGRVSGDCYYVADAGLGKQNSILFELVATSRRYPLLRSLPARTVLRVRDGLPGLLCTSD